MVERDRVLELILLHDGTMKLVSEVSCLQLMNAAASRSQGKARSASDRHDAAHLRAVSLAMLPILTRSHL
jgi:hypothetical protein